MWILKAKIRHDDWILKKTLKYDIAAFGIPLNHYKKDGTIYHNGMVSISGKKENKEKFIASVKRDKRIKRCKVVGSQLFVLVKDDGTLAPSVPKDVFYVKPVYFKEGYEYWEIASWEKKSLISFFESTKKLAEVELQSLVQEDPKVFVQHAVPSLTEKQQQAIELALSFGYYTHPRKISVEQLAKKAKMPRTSFQDHLRKAEAKVMPMLLSGI